MPTIPFTPNKPDATDLLSTSQPTLKQNFQGIQLWNDFNHLDFTSANAGKHNFIELPLITTARPVGPSPITGTDAGEVALFCQASVINPSAPSLWLAKQSTLLANAIEFSEYKTGNSGTPVHDYLVFKLPNGLIVKIGRLQPPQDVDGSGITVTFPVAAGIPAFTTTPFVMLTTITNNASDPNTAQKALYQMVSPTTTTFVATADEDGNTKSGFTYFAIGA